MSAAEARELATDYALQTAWRIGERMRRHGEITNAQFYADYRALERRLRPPGDPARAPTTANRGDAP